MNGAKIPFWQLFSLFFIITIIALSQLWAVPADKPAGMMTQMMGSSMGEMMRMMHASNVTLNDLLWWHTEEQGVKQSKHGQFSPFLYQVHSLTTKVIFLLTPFILAGAAVLVASWLWGD